MVTKRKQYKEIFVVITLKEVFHENWYPMTEKEFIAFQDTFKPRSITCQSLGCGIPMSLYDEDDETLYTGLCYYESFCETCRRSMCAGHIHGLEQSCKSCDRRFCWNCSDFTFDCSNSLYWYSQAKIVCQSHLEEDNDDDDDDEWL